MSPRTYVGPFGRILPLPEGSEPEQPPPPASEARAEPKLPQPELNFGSDTSLGFNNPTAHNRRNQDGRKDEPSSSYGYSVGHGQDALPPVRQILTPGFHSNVSNSPYRPTRASHTSPHYSFRGMDGSSRVAGQASERPPSSVQEIPTQPHESYPVGAEHSDSHQYPIYSRTELDRRTSLLPATSSRYMPYEQSLQQASHQYEPQFSQRPELAVPTPPRLSPKFSSSIKSPFGGGMIKPLEAAESSALMPKESSPSQTSPNEVKPMPKVIREETRPNQGPVWVYEDGSTCPKLIDGEPVNADWGVTKAGKPRKRLAIACTSCREKKIKCDPAEPKCAQCRKFGRDCKYATVPRHPRIKSESPSYKSQAYVKFMNDKTEALQDNPYESGDRAPTIDIRAKSATRFVSPQPKSTPPSEESRHALRFADLSPSIKKRRLSPPANLNQPLKDIDETHLLTTASETKPSIINGSNINRSQICAESSSGSMEPYLLTHYIELFVANVGFRAMPSVSQTDLIDWLDTDAAKTPESLILVHAMIGLGTAFAKGEEPKMHGKRMSEMVKAALQEHPTKYCTRICQARLLLALYYSLCGETHEACHIAASNLPISLDIKMEETTKEKALGIG